MNKRDIYKEIVTILDGLEGAKRLTISAASSHQLLTDLVARLGEEATAEESRNLMDGSNIPVDPESLRQIADSLNFDVDVTPALLRRAAKAIEDATAQMRAAEEVTEELRQRPTRDLDAAREVAADLRTQLDEAKADVEAIRGNPLRLMRKMFPDAHIRIDFPPIVEPGPEPAEPG